MTRLSVQLDRSELEQFLSAAPQKIFNAQRSAIRTTTTFTEKALKSRMAAASGLPSTVFKTVRILKKVSDQRGIVWLGFNPVKAKYAGKLSQEPGGAMAGQYYWPGGFVAKMKSGHLSIFKRQGAKRLPLIEQTVELPYAEEIAASVFIETQTELQRRYEEKLREALE